MSTPWGANATKPTYFQIQAGKLDQQVTAFIDKHDTDGDHALSLDEVREAGGLTNPTKFKSNSLAMTQSLWKAISGPSNTINAKEYAQYLILLDADQNTQITQREVDALFSTWTNHINTKPQTALKNIYQELVSVGQKFGITSFFQNAEEEAFALGEPLKKPPSTTEIRKPSISPVTTSPKPTKNVGMPSFRPLDLTTPFIDTVSPFLITPIAPNNTNIATQTNTNSPYSNLTVQDFMSVHASQNQPYINPQYLGAVNTSLTSNNSLSNIFGGFTGSSLPSQWVNSFIASKSASNRWDASGLPIV
jgi:hypothetical protein